MGLRFKMLSGFLILSAVLLLAGAWSIYQMRDLGSAFQEILNDNYKSINAAKKMGEALEREDSGVLLLIMGNGEEGRAVIESADRLFQENLGIAGNNITIPGEEKHIDAISTSYLAFKKLWQKPIVDTKREDVLGWYSREVNPAFMHAAAAVEGLLTINDNELYKTASDSTIRATRAIMPGIVAILAAFFFSLMFSYFVNLYVVNPIIRITKGIHLFRENDQPFSVEVETHDEISRLASAIRELCSSRSRAGSGDSR